MGGAAEGEIRAADASAEAAEGEIRAADASAEAAEGEIRAADAWAEAAFASAEGAPRGLYFFTRAMNEPVAAATGRLS